MTTPKPYQLATVDAAYEVLKAKSGRPRYLVADEVGLGKTVVAQHVIKMMAKGKRKPLVVYYVCSSLTIAAQNRKKLVEAVALGEKVEEAICAADRLSLLPFEKRPKNSKVHLYTLTPDTALPGRKGKRRDGRKEERALIYHLVEKCWPGLLKPKVFQRNARNHWKGTLQWASHTLESCKGQHGISIGVLKSLFREKVREELKLPAGGHVPSAIRQFDTKRDALDLISKFRTALIKCVFELDGLQPDLVIFDEFQRFKDLIQPCTTINGTTENNLDPIVRRLRGDSGRCTPLLLLSATPYSLYSQRDESELFGSHHDQLLELLCFLYGDGEAGRKDAEKTKALFTEFASQLRRPKLDYEAIEAAKEGIEKQLTRVMSRTERAQIEKAIKANTKELKDSPQPVKVETDEQDWRVFRHLSERFHQQYRNTAVTYWRSIPLPMQTMGSGYLAWRSAQKTHSAGNTPTFPPTDGKNPRSPHWPHPKLRKLIASVGADTLCLPWISPSVPWWSLDKRWQNESAKQGKLLLFSRFRATPKAVAAALSHEARALAYRSGKLPAVNSSSLPLNTERMPVFALFYPSLWLAEACDPLLAAGRRPKEVHQLVRRQLAEHLKANGIVVKTSQGRRKFWHLLAALDWQLSPAGELNAQRESLPVEVVQIWKNAAHSSVTSITPSELDELATHALGAPGVVLARSIRRHFNPESLLESYAEILKLSLHAWRNYFDNRVFVAALRQRKSSYPQALQHAVFHGNLEAVLDEHLWYTTLGGDISLTDTLQQFGIAIGLSGGHVSIHHPNNHTTLFRAQCDVALPLAQELEPSSTQTDAPPLRTDQIRTAFNSPFWPFVLATTSVGQEGLDFHPWCKTLLHWDLPGNPVDLEQREGRIKRFAGLSVRQAMARDKRDEVLAAATRNGSPWKTIQNLVDSEHYPDDPGLKPWWHYPGASVESLFYHMPVSDEIQQLAQLKQQRMLYRLALGQQHQEDFVRMVGTRDSADLVRLLELTPNLSAWSRKHQSKKR